VPVRVDYELTPLGHSLLPAVQMLKAWAEDNIEAVESARTAYDAVAVRGA
jgi:DNA-binding HxlR family transcriptional regulator